jgi:hypothetical protein
MMLSVNLYAKRRGAKLIITKKEGQQVEGELITVKQNSLLLLNNEGKDVSIDIADIKVIKVVKKSLEKAGLGGAIGLLIGAGGGALVGLSIFEDDPPGFLSMTAEFKALMFGLSIGGLGMIIGMIIGPFVVKDKTIQTEGMSDWEIQRTLKKLRKKARIRKYK